MLLLVMFDVVWSLLTVGVRAVSATPVQAPVRMEVGFLIDMVKTLHQHLMWVQQGRNIQEAPKAWREMSTSSCFPRGPAFHEYNFGNEASCNTLWWHVLDTVSEHLEHLWPLMSAAHELPEYLKPQTDESDSSSIANGFVESTLVDHFLHKGCTESILSTLATLITDRLNMTMHNASVDLSIFYDPLSIFTGYIKRGIPRSA
ncbi:hypothetical protein WOLCODRAFT_21024 [Wolfiporia cocos MD-104 SS10]|uniref:Uncharacterized protein n=1 Tax=Wolfiporia cocos (strain MD-104) TaxID=742152 RepID=A0A2H3JF28_WOLCO|nr:hypothetical protein WOLCODRAFT_21024 [Wolfiporia cocos MD-104 SS10]